MVKIGGTMWMTMIMAAGMVMMMVTCAEGRTRPYLHRVGGGNNGWRENVNYTDWAATEDSQLRFYTGDWLYFGFDKHRYNVLQVNKTSYESCNDQGFIKNITQGGRDVYELKVPMQYFFLSGGGYCYQGMKLAIDVVDFIEAPAPAPAKAGSAVTNNIWNSVPVLILAVSLVSAIIFNPLW